MFGTVVCTIFAAPASRSFSRALLLVSSLLIVLGGCSSPNTAQLELSQVPGSAVQSIVTYYLNRYKAQYQLEPRPEGSLQAVAEAYLQRYQPGPLPRVFQSSIVYDRQGRVLAEVFDEGRRIWAPLSRISPYLLDAFIATEDGSFFQNDGVDVRRLVGALVQNSESDEVVSGASTITMQLARMMFLPPSERFSVSLDRKINEALLADDLTDLFTKDEILELYLNFAYFGHLAYGPEAAAQAYFGKPAADLTLAEAALLAGLPQQPAFLDPFLNMEGAKQRQQIVLDLMVRRGYITQFEADLAASEPIVLASDPDLRPVLAPHFLQFLTDYLEDAPQPYNLARAGLKVHTTLDLDMQNLAQQIVRENVDALRGTYNLNNAALMALKPGTSEILVMVGSADYTNRDIGGQVNVTMRLRQPGSTMKPVVYSMALERGLISPATLLWDLPVKYPTEAGKEYSPRNYDERFRGPVTVRMALANSLNVPTIKLFDGIEPSEFITVANKMGISSLSNDKLANYGLSTALGGVEVSLYDMAAAYQTIVNGGRFVEPTPVRQITTSDGQRVQIPPKREPVQAISPETAFLITDMISDNVARAPTFGENSRLKLSRPAAAKTGTTTSFRDNWTIGFTKYLVAGVWAGNNDGTPMRNADGITGAGPIWNKFMEAVLANPSMLKVLDAPASSIAAAEQAAAALTAGQPAPQPQAGAPLTPEQEADQAAWAFTPPVGVTQVPRACPPELRCREGGEYFAQSWLDRMAAASPYADSFISGVMAPVEVQFNNGQVGRPAVCVMRLTGQEDLQARSLLVLPRGVGRLTMEWLNPETDLVADTNGAPVLLTDEAPAAKLASVGIIDAPISAPLLLPTATTGSVTRTVLVDSSLPPMLLLDLPYEPGQAVAGNQTIATGSPGSELESEQQLVLATNKRVRDEQTEVLRWARNNGNYLVWGDCGHAYQWAVAVYGNSVRNVTIGQPLPGVAQVAAAATQQPAANQQQPAANQQQPVVVEQAPSIPEVVEVVEPVVQTVDTGSYSGGANGLYAPGGMVSGVVGVQGAASLPDFWKWQLDILINGQHASFLSVGEQPVPSATTLMSLNTANYPNGDHVLRLRVVHRDGNYEEYYLPVTIAN